MGGADWVWDGGNAVPGAAGVGNMPVPGAGPAALAAPAGAAAADLGCRFWSAHLK